MLKQKLSDIFRSKKEKVVEQTKKQQPMYFNESYFDCKLAYNPHKLSLIKVIANITVGPDAGMPMMVNCKWLIKKNNQYSQIQGVTSSCYQPCIEDVGCSILVQITPLIEGKIYSGALITKQTGPLQLGSALQTQFTQTKTKLYYQKQSIQFNMKVEAVFGKQTEYSNLEYPQDGKIIIRKHQDNNFQIQIITAQFKAYFWITKQFPTTQFIRKSYNSVVISFTEYQSMRLAFKQGADRQIIGLLLRTLTANSTLDWPTKEDQIQQINIQQNRQDQKQLKVLDFKEQTSIQNLQQNNSETKNNQEQSNQNNSVFEKKQSQNESQLIKSQQYQKTTPIKSQKSMGSHQNLSIQITTPNKYQSQSLPQSSSKTVEYQFKIGELNIELNKTKKQFKDLMKNYNIEKQNKCKLQIQVKKLSDKLAEFDKLKKEKDELFTSNQKFKQDNRFYRNQVTLINKSLKQKQTELLALKNEKQQLQKKIAKLQINQVEYKKSGKKENSYLLNEQQHWRKYNNQLTEQNEQLKNQIEKLQNSLTTANKKIQSLHHEKVINNQYQQIKSQPNIPIHSNWNSITNTNANQSQIQKQLSSKDKTISTLQFKISNLEMLLKYKSGEKGNQSLALHKIINNLTEDIRQKEEQLQSIKKINKQLMEKIKKIQSK